MLFLLLFLGAKIHFYEGKGVLIGKWDEEVNRRVGFSSAMKCIVSYGDK